MQLVIFFLATEEAFFCDPMCLRIPRYILSKDKGFLRLRPVFTIVLDVHCLVGGLWLRNE